MTERLYYQDAYQRSFEATVLESVTRAGMPAVALDRTCFYPTSGGQLHDTGTIGGVGVVEVIADDGVVWHILDTGPGFSAGDTVTGVIDWPRRYDHMQQHSGQHLLSQLFYQRCGFETVSVHFGREESTLDLDAPAIEPALLDAFEREVNELAYCALDIRAYFVGDEDARNLPLRRPPAVTGQIRIIEIDGFDYSACGGTHVRTTAEIAPIKLLRQERRRGQTRLTYLCGLRACSDYQDKHRLLVESAAYFSTDGAALPSAIQRVQTQARDLERQNELLREQLLAVEVAKLIARAERVDGMTVVEHLSGDMPADTLKQMAALLRAQPNVAALLASTAGDKLTVVFCRSDDLAFHAGNLLRDTLAGFGGRGGGRPEYAQGGGIAASAALDLLADARRRLLQSG